MTRLLGLATLFYVPHLAEEALTSMHDDPIIAAALAPFDALSPRHAVYLMFQAMLLVTLVTALLVGSGRAGRVVVLAGLAISMLAEAHHLVRACATAHYNSGLLTALPMPLFGLYLLAQLTRAERRQPALLAH